MTTSTIERAYQLARSGEAPDLEALKRLLKAEGCRAVDALLAPRNLRGHLAAICLAASGPATPGAMDSAKGPQTNGDGPASPRG